MGIVSALGFAACAGGLVPLALPTGPNTATISVTLPHTGNPSFTGTVAGRSLTGVAIGRPAETPSKPFFTWKGTLGGHPYLLHIGIELRQPVNSRQDILGDFNFVVTGSYGSDAVAATSNFKFNLSDVNRLTVPFTGHVGPQKVTGSATATMKGKGLRITATASIR